MSNLNFGCRLLNRSKSYIVLLLLGGLIVLTQGSAVAPFIYLLIQSVCVEIGK
jgi:hypothetical protein